MSIIFKLAQFLERETPALRSHYYRYRNLFQKPLSDIDLLGEFSSKKNRDLLFLMSAYGPLQISDIESLELRKILSRWLKQYPQDPKFYRHTYEILQWIEENSNLSLLKFMKTPQFLGWMQKRSRLKRAPAFEMDSHYKSSKQSALAHELKVRNILRKNPLLRYEDLKLLGVKNLQPILERFPQLALHRKLFLEKLRAQTARE